MDSETPPAEPASRFALVVIGALCTLALLVVAAFVVIQSPEQIEEGTPEATVQAYLQAINDGDLDTAFQQLEPSLAARCDDRLDDWRFRTWSSERAELGEVEVSDNSSATVEVRFRYGDVNDPFDSSDWTNSVSFELTRTDADGWKISEPVWPYWLRDC